MIRSLPSALALLLVLLGSCRESRPAPPAHRATASPRAARRSPPVGVHMSEAVFHEILERLYLAIDQRLGQLARLSDAKQRAAGLRELLPTSAWTTRQRQRILAELGVTQRQLSAWVRHHEDLVQAHGARHARRIADAFKAYGLDR